MNKCIIHWRKKLKKKVNHNQKKLLLKKVKLRRQKADDQDLSNMPLLEGDEVKLDDILPPES